MMERTPQGTPVGVDDPYALVERCDHLTDGGRCRLAVERPRADPAFADALATDGYECLVAAADRTWADCPQFRSRDTAEECARCGLPEHRMAHREDRRPLLEEHHLSYADGEGSTGHEITAVLCRWCHAKVHGSWARIADDVSPDPEAIAEREGRRSAELAEATFRTAAERRDE